MDFYAGLDVSLELTNICVVDGEGRVVHEARVGSDPEILTNELKRIGDNFVRVGFEAGPLSQWLYFGLDRSTSRASHARRWLTPCTRQAWATASRFASGVTIFLQRHP